MPRSVRQSYQMHVANSKRRGIPFKLTFDEWISIWKRSRKFPSRGRGPGKYVMSRIGDVGAYEVGNVKIILWSKNFRIGQKNQRWTEDRCNKIRVRMLGRKRPDLSAFNRSRKGKKLCQRHRDNIGAGLLGKKRGPYKIKEN